MRKMMALGLLLFVAAACADRQSDRQDAGAAQDTRTAQDTRGASKAPSKVTIKVKLKKEDGKCVVKDPGTTQVEAGQVVNWRYQNNGGCTGEKKQRIDPKNAPIRGTCNNDTTVPENEERDGEDCTVNMDAPPGRHKYGIEGTHSLDPELELPPPPPPPTPTPTPEAK